MHSRLKLRADKGLKDLLLLSNLNLNSLALLYCTTITKRCTLLTFTTATDGQIGDSVEDALGGGGRGSRIY